MKKVLSIIAVVVLSIFSCKKEEINLQSKGDNSVKNYTCECFITCTNALPSGDVYYNGKEIEHNNGYALFKVIPGGKIEVMSYYTGLYQGATPLGSASAEIRIEGVSVGWSTGTHYPNDKKTFIVE